MGSGGIAPRFLNFGTGQFHVLVALLPVKSLWYPLDGPQSRSGRGGEEKKSLPLLGPNPGGPVTVLTELRRLRVAVVLVPS
jgi:hypothetical protein